MNSEVFVDTNILFYAHTQTADPRHDRARVSIRTLWDQPGAAAAVSVQVPQELHVNLVRKAGMDAGQSAERINDYLA